MRDMAHSICLLKLYQITMRKTFRFFVSDYLRDWSLLMPGTGAEGISMGHENFQAHNVGS